MGACKSSGHFRFHGVLQQFPAKFHVIISWDPLQTGLCGVGESSVTIYAIFLPKLLTFGGIVERSM